MNKLRVSKLILLACAALALLLSPRQPQLAQKSFVRAVLFEQNETGYSVGLLYQDVAASADAADAGETLRLVTGAQATLAEAFADAERELPQRADYKLCDYAVLCGRNAIEPLLAYGELLLEGSAQGRLAAYLYGCEETVHQLESCAETDDAFLFEWMDTLQGRRDTCPRLHSGLNGAAAIPMLTVKDGKPSPWCDGAMLLGASGCAERLDETTAQMLWILQGRGGEHRLWLADRQLVLTGCRVEKTADETGAVQLTIYAACKSPGNSGQIAAHLEVLARQALAVCGDGAGQLLGLDAVRAMAGTGGAAIPNAVTVSVELAE